MVVVCSAHDVIRQETMTLRSSAVLYKSEPIYFLDNKTVIELYLY